jgi:hypothetical protein
VNIEPSHCIAEEIIFAFEKRDEQRTQQKQHRHRTIAAYMRQRPPHAAAADKHDALAIKRATIIAQSQMATSANLPL